MKIKISENKIRKSIRESIQRVLNEAPAYSLDYYDNNNADADNVITEMARINTKEPSGSLFPYNEYNIHIWSNDHVPAHFHVQRDDWDVEFYIENGELYKIKNRGKDYKIYNYIVKNIKKWLNTKCSVLPAVTNQENAMSIWEQLHS